MEDNSGMDTNGAEVVFGEGIPAYGFGQEAIELEKEDEAELWGEGSFRLFICHLPRHRNFAVSLKKHFVKYNIAAYVARPETETTSLGEVRVGYALFSMDALAALVSKGFHIHEWTDQEIGVAIGLRKTVIPIVISTSEPQGFLGRLPAIRKKELVDHQVALEIIMTLYNDLELKPKMGACIVYRFERTRDMQDVERMLEVVENLDYLPEPLITRLENAASHNINISRSMEVSKRLPMVIVRLKKALTGNFS